MSTRNSGLDRSPIHLLHRAYQASAAVFGAEMKVDGLTPRQLTILVAIGQNEGASQTGIVDITGVDRSTLAEMIKRLQRRGLIQRRRMKDDARAYALKLTDEGQRLVRTVAPITKRIDERVLGALSSSHRELFIGALQTIVTILQSTTGDGRLISS